MLQLRMHGEGDRLFIVQPMQIGAMSQLNLHVVEKKGADWDFRLSTVPLSLFRAVHPALAGVQGLDKPVAFSERSFEGRIASGQSSLYELMIVRRGRGWSEVTVYSAIDDLVTLAYWLGQLPW